MPTLDQIRAARALLNWSQSDLASRADLSQTGIARIESGVNQPNMVTMEKIEQAFDAAGIDFIADRGVERRVNTITSLKGREGLRHLYDDVYANLKIQGGEFLLSNVSQKFWEDCVGLDFANAHRDRMRKLGNFVMKATLKEGDKNFTIGDYCEFRWVKEDLYDAVTFCVYAGQLAFVIFNPEDVRVYIIKDETLVHAYEKQFYALWEMAFPLSNR